MSGYQFTEEDRQRSAEARNGTERARKVILAKQSALAKQLVDMALGVDDWVKLDHKDRLTATLRALEWGMGKPTVTKAGMSASKTADKPPVMTIE